ncbi:hypothetical protein MLD59_22590 [Verrucomicrobiaceae bacterium E54]|nr:hypothetical protein [Verrucomicrobiaceae bacterium E54]
MKPGIVVACLACFAAGLLLGHLIPPKPDGMREAGRLGEHAPSRSSLDGPARSLERALDGESEDRVGKSESQGAATPGEDLVQVPFTLLAELGRAERVLSIDHPIISRDGRIEQILKITDREKEALQTAWRNSRAAIRDAEAAAVMMEELEDGSARLTLPDLSDRREAVADGCASSIRKILGQSRGDVFLAVRQVPSAFESQGGNWSCTVAPEATGDGRWRFHMTIEDAKGRRVWVGESIPDEIRHLAEAAGVVSSLNDSTGP